MEQILAIALVMLPHPAPIYGEFGRPFYGETVGAWIYGPTSDKCKTGQVR